jgi:hypothetical protein
MEPDWTKQVPSWLICDYFYAFFILSATISAIVVVTLVFVLARTGFKDGFKVLMLLVQLGLATTSTLFYYILCDRALKPIQ